MRIIQGGQFAKRTMEGRQETHTLYGQSLSTPLHFFHVTYSKINKLWYVKEIAGPTYSIHTSKEKALREARELADFEENGQIVLHHENGVLEIIERERH